MRVVLVAAVAANGVIGAAQGIPWRLPGEQLRFKELTMGRTMVMGRRTFESIGRVLPGRRTVVVTRDRSWRHDGVETAASLDAALAAHAGEDEVMVVGGGQIYAAAMPYADRLEISHVDREVPGDTVFPEIDATWQPTAKFAQDGWIAVTYEPRTAPQPGPAPA